MSTRRYRMLLAYDGTAYAGWQVQPRHRTVQGELERVLEQLTGRPVRVEASGRTDSGVHARGQVAHFDLTDMVIDPDRLQVGLNALLDPDIRVAAVKPTPSTFHARFSAKGKEYRYFIHNDPVVPPFDQRYRTHIRQPLDAAAMQQAAGWLVGRHDFAAFAANPNREIDGTVRTVYRLSVSRKGPLLTLRACGDGFLYKMVRSLAGYLIRVGAGEVAPEAARATLESRVRTARVPTAAPEGLFLWRVYYHRPPAP